MKLIPITYHGKQYPFYIKSEIDEIAGHLDKEKIEPTRRYSLHTEYAHMKRKLDSDKIKRYSVIRISKNGVPKLWFNKTWAEEFADFIIELVGKNPSPDIIEIHPPFNDYCHNMDEFFNIYERFEKIIAKVFPNTDILIENRCGTFYTGGSFLISNVQSIMEFLDNLSRRNLKLKMVLDYPQVFSAEKINMDNIKLDKIIDFNKRLKPYLHLIKGIHLWGKRKNNTDTKWTPHTGDLNTFFSYDFDLKNEFLKSIMETFDDTERRYFVPEVNSTEEDLESIISDLVAFGAEFPIEKVEEDDYDYKMVQALVWKERKAYFDIYDSKKKTEELIPVTEIKKIAKGLHRRCIGYKNLKTSEHELCSEHSIVPDNIRQCISCRSKDVFSYCAMCKGDNCHNKSLDAKNYCDEPHYVYLAYFAKDKIKVGTLYHKRTISRLEEQGAPFAFRIAKAPSGKIVRIIEHEIVKMGYAEAVNSSFKANHILIDNDKETIIEILNENINKIKENISSDLKKYFIPIEEYDDLDKVEKIKEELVKGSYEQPTLFGVSEVHFEIERITPFFEDMHVVGALGSLVFLKKDNKNYYFNTKELIGYEIESIM